MYTEENRQQERERQSGERQERERRSGSQQGRERRNGSQQENRQQGRERRSRSQQENRQQGRTQWEDERLKTGLPDRELRRVEQWEEEQAERRERARQKRRRQRIEQMKREKRRREMLFRYGVPTAAVLCVFLLIIGISRAVRPGDDSDNGQKEGAGTAVVQDGVPDSEGNRQAPSTSVQGGVPDSEGNRQAPPASVQGGVPDSEGNRQAPPASVQGGVPDSEGNRQAPPASVQDSVPDGAENRQTIQSAVQEAVPTALRQTQAGILSGAGSIQGTAAYAIGSPQQEAPQPVFEAHATEHTDGFSDAILSSHGIMIDVESGEVLAQKDGWSRINPASMTKILTVLVAAEHITDFEDTFTMTIDITDYSFRNDCSNVGFEVGEVIPIKDLFYGTALPSGADAALGLAVYTAGSHEAFVDMMNAKLEELGLSETSHFTNCVGLYDENHYSTAYDMAVILKEAADNEFCRQVLSEHHYVTASTAEHPEGIDISNWFLRRIEDRDTHGEVLCAKTGYIDQSRSCAASLGTDHGGREYICVTAGSNSSWTCIRDQVELYQRYLPE